MLIIIDSSFEKLLNDKSKWTRNLYDSDITSPICLAQDDDV